METVYSNTIGLKISFVVDSELIKDAESATIIWELPSKKIIEVPAEIDVANNTIFHITKEGELTETGVHNLQAKIKTVQGLQTFSEPVSFGVKKGLV